MRFISYLVREIYNTEDEEYRKVLLERFKSHEYYNSNKLIIKRIVVNMDLEGNTRLYLYFRNKKKCIFRIKYEETETVVRYANQCYLLYFLLVNRGSLEDILVEELKFNGFYINEEQEEELQRVFRFMRVNFEEERNDKIKSKENNSCTCI